MRTEDGQIIRKCLDGDKAAFGLLVDKYRESIYALAYSKLGNFHDAEDVAQEAFIKAYENLRSLKYWDCFLSWLYSITSNICKMRIRAQSRRPDHDLIEDKDLKALESSSVVSYREDLMYESLQEALNALPEMHRQVLTLFYLGGMSCKEMARFLGTSPNTIRQRLYNARLQLREEMLAMMITTYEGQRLRAGFTLRIVEAIKRIKFHPTPWIKGLPWGLSLATGIIITTIMILNPNPISFSHVGTPLCRPLPSETNVLKVGEIPVNLAKISKITIISSQQGNGTGGEPRQPNENAFFMDPQGQGDTWTKKADMPTARFALSASMVDGKIYAIGGTIGGPLSMSTVEEYDPKTDTWTRKADMPTARQSFSTSAVNGKIYAIGGFNKDADISTVEEYNPATDTWTKKADMPTAREHLSTCEMNGRIYAIGGLSWGSTVSKVEEYDPKTDTWTKKADMPTARDTLSIGAVYGKIYAIGGREFWKEGLFSTVEEYDPKTDTWTKKTDMPTARYGLSTSPVNGKIYAIGGMNTAGMFFRQWRNMI